MQDLLLESWSPQFVAYRRQYPWRVFAAGLTVAVVAVQVMFGRPGSSGGDAGGCDSGDGDGGSCGD